MKTFCIGLLVGLLLASGALHAAQENPTGNKPKETYFEDRGRGWFWYETAPRPAQPAEGQVGAASELSAREIIELQKQAWEDAQAEAVLRPTEANVARYMEATRRVMEQGQGFADAFQHAIWKNPEYDYTATRPMNGQAAIAFNQSKQGESERLLAETAEAAGLIYFFRSDCPYCARFSPVLKKFAAAFGFTIIPVSLDGKGTADFPYPKPNFELGRKLNVSVVPALFLLEPDKNKVVTVGYGYSDFTQLMKKVGYAASQLAGDANGLAGGSP